MTFFDIKRPNKYNYLKRKIFPFKLPYGYNKKRYGGEKDGSYVFVEKLFDKSKFVYSYGIGEQVSALCFDRHAAELGKTVYMYEGSIDQLPYNHENFVFKSEYLYAEGISNHITENGHKNETNMVLKMDIEGHEYSVINTDINIIKDHFDQLSIEMHSLIEEIPEGWDIQEPMLYMKTNHAAKEDFFDKILEHYNIVHIHGNNHAPRHVDFPDSLEITFLRKDHRVLEIDKSIFPIDGLDYPNYNDTEDYVLDWWI